MRNKAKFSTSIYPRRPVRRWGFLFGVGSVIDLYGSNRVKASPIAPGGFEEDARQLASDFSVAAQDIRETYFLSDSSAT